MPLETDLTKNAVFVTPGVGSRNRAFYKFAWSEKFKKTYDCTTLSGGFNGAKRFKIASFLDEI